MPRFQYLLSPGTNSGIGLRTVPGETADGHKIPHHLEVQILDDNKYRKEDGTLDAPTGSIFWCKRGPGYLRPDQVAHLKPIGSWNDMEIELGGQRLQVWVNGRLVQDADLNRLAALSDALPGLKRTSGRIGFQQQTGQVRFRNITIEELPGTLQNIPTSSTGYRGTPKTAPQPLPPPVADSPLLRPRVGRC